MSRSKVSRLGLGLVGLAALGAAGVLYFGDGAAVRAAGLEPEVAASATSAAGHGALSLEAERMPSASLSVGGESLAEAFLSSYYGGEAAEVRAALEARGVEVQGLNPPAPVDEFQAMLPMWLTFKDVERESWREELEMWPKELGSEWLQQHLGIIVELTDDDVEAIDALAKLYSPDIYAATDRYLDAVEGAMFDELQWGGIKTSPFLAWPPASPDEKRAFFSMVRAGQGWVARIKLNKEEHPVAFQARGAIAGEVAKRDADLRRTLLALQ
jgi:hypothetical protein